MKKKGKFNYTRNRKKLRQREKARLKIRNQIIDSSWQHKVSVKNNFERLGLTYDSNELFKISNRNTEPDKIPKLFKKTKVVEALEEAAKHKKARPLFMSEDDQLFCIYNIEVHGNDFLAMTRDPKNAYQLTSKQLEHLIEKFKQTPRYSTYLKEKEAGTFDLSDFYDITMA